MAKLLSVSVVPPLQGRFEELAGVLADLPIELVPFERLSSSVLPVATGDTLAEVAAQRARLALPHCLMLTIAEAAGVEVDALGGRPGVRSAYFAHERATDAENNAALLGALDAELGLPRTARMRTVFAVVTPWDDEVRFAVGICEGEISRTPSESGYGYTSLFAVSELRGQRMAELSEAERSAVSPRRRATHELRRVLDGLLNEQLARWGAQFPSSV